LIVARVSCLCEHIWAEDSRERQRLGGEFLVIEDDSPAGRLRSQELTDETPVPLLLH